MSRARAHDASARDDLPSGTVTFLFTDVEGSTRLLHERGAEGYAEALAEHRRVIRETCSRHGGVEVDTQGDAFFVAFPTVPGALAAAVEVTEALASGPIRVRMGLHTGTPLLTSEGYVGGDVHRAARIASAGHGGQVLVSSSTAALADVDLRDLGEHRFKDLSAPERVYQLGGVEFPSLKSLYRTNLPVPATPFLGRESELTEVLSLLSEGRTRLLTLTGPGGTGKTRLALQAAAEASDSFPDGVWWVPLAPLRDPELVLETAAQVVGSKNGLAEHIRDKEMLCLFDNFEHVIEAGAELAELLASCPKLEVVVTSRERLRVRGEQTYPVPPLAENDGVALFVTRARAVDPSFTGGDAVRELCSRLDSLPLALELSAARTALFSPEQLLERLSDRLDLLKGERDADPRQQTLRATIDWSYDLLTAEEQRLYACLSVFAGGCSYEAAERVAGADPDRLQSLLDKSLLRKRDSEAGPRYWMLETIREYAAERLDASGEAAQVRRRHAEYFLAFVEEEGDPRTYLGSPREKERMDRIARDHDNVRAALNQLEALGEGEPALQLAGAMWPFWAMRGLNAEGRRRLESALLGDGRPTAARARALTGVVGMLDTVGDSAGAKGRAEEALVLYRELDDPWGTAHSVYMLGHVAGGEGDYERAKQLWEESLRGFRELGDDHFVSLSTDAVAWLYDELGDRERARVLYDENLRRARATSNRRMEAYALEQLGVLAVREGRVQEALSMLAESLAVYGSLDLPMETAEGLSSFAFAAAEAGGAETAARLLASSRASFEELGSSVPFWVAKRDDTTLFRIHEQLDEGPFAEVWEEGAELTLEEAIALALGFSE